MSPRQLPRRTWRLSIEISVPTQSRSQAAGRGGTRGHDALCTRQSTPGAGEVKPRQSILPVGLVKWVSAASAAAGAASPARAAATPSAPSGIARMPHHTPTAGSPDPGPLRLRLPDARGEHRSSRHEAVGPSARGALARLHRRRAGGQQHRPDHRAGRASAPGERAPVAHPAGVRRRHRRGRLPGGPAAAAQLEAVAAHGAAGGMDLGDGLERADPHLLAPGPAHRVRRGHRRRRDRGRRDLLLVQRGLCVRRHPARPGRPAPRLPAGQDRGGGS